MKKSPLESKRKKANLKGNLRLVLSNEDILNVQPTIVENNSIMDMQEKYQCEPIQIGSKECDLKNQSSRDQSSYLVLTESEMFLKKDLSEEPIDLNPWCKEWTTSCLDEDLLSSNLDVQHMFCIDHFTGLPTLQDPRSSTELSTSQPIAAIFEHKSIPKEDIIYDFDQHILNIYSDSHDNENNNVLSPPTINNETDEMDVSQQARIQANDSNVWENIESVANDKLDTASFYLNKFEQNNEESPNTTLILSPAESDIFFETFTVVDPMDTLHSLNNNSGTTIGRLEPSDIKTSDEIFVEQSIDFGFISNNIIESDKQETIAESENYVSSKLTLIDSNKPTLNIKLVPESSDCIVNTPDVIDNAISLESDFNLLSYIDNDTTSISSVSSDITKLLPLDDFCEIKSESKKSKYSSSESHLSKTLKAKKKQEKRGRPPKLLGSPIKVEFIPGETEDDFKYRELRNKNNEASRRSRMLRKERETQILTTLQDLEKHHQKLINSVSHLEEECKKYRSKLLDAMSK